MSEAGIRVARGMNVIKAKLTALGVQPREAEEMAFHLSDVADDLEMLTKFIKKASSRNGITSHEVDQALDALQFHVYHHVKNLSKLANQTERLSQSNKTEVVKGVGPA
ncbi:MAG: hypothetical protein ABSG59_20685 [Verrucomicrobiota bacterium]